MTPPPELQRCNYSRTENENCHLHVSREPSNCSYIGGSMLANIILIKSKNETQLMRWKWEKELRRKKLQKRANKIKEKMGKKCLIWNETKNNGAKIKNTDDELERWNDKGAENIKETSRGHQRSHSSHVFCAWRLKKRKEKKRKPGFPFGKITFWGGTFRLAAILTKSEIILSSRQQTLTKGKFSLFSYLLNIHSITYMI